MREKQIFEGTLNILLNNSKQNAAMPKKKQTKLMSLLAVIVSFFDNEPGVTLRNKVSMLSAQDKQQKRKSYSPKNYTRLSHKQQKNSG
jgi:hypothetical protein